MKKTMKHLLVFAIVFATLSSNANEATSITNEKAGKTTLVIENVLKGEQLFVKDAFGSVLYTEAISKNGQYNKSFDLSSLPEGNYYFELDKKMLIKTIPFKISFNSVVYNKNEESIFYKPVVKVKDNLVSIQQLSMDKSLLDIKIYYSNNNDFELINAEEVTNTTNIKRAYRLDSTKTGVYKVVFESNGQTITKYFTL